MAAAATSWLWSPRKVPSIRPGRSPVTRWRWRPASRPWSSCGSRDTTTPFFTAQAVTDYASAKTADTDRHAAFFHALLDAGVYLPPSQFEAAFVSAAHTEADIELTLEAAAAALQSLAG